ncbi:MAG: hypothetical protein U9O87_05285 [Verrucomicrobiota bacterium]|nr:hypothetical protein [Verrucomicrobiota bacterium]
MKHSIYIQFILLFFLFTASFILAETIIPKSVLKDIHQLLEIEVNKKVTQEDVAQKIKIPYPPISPKFSLKEIEQLIKKGEKDALKKESSNYGKTDYKAEAKKKFKIYRIGEKISITLKTTERISGTLQKITGRRIKIDGDWINCIAINNKSLYRLLPNKHNEMVKKYIINKKRDENYRKVKIMTKAHNYLTEKFYKENGYTKRKGKWVTQTKLLEQATWWYKKNMARRLKKGFFKKEFIKRGYIYKDGKWNKVLPDVISTVAKVEQLAENLKPPKTPEVTPSPEALKPPKTEKTPEVTPSPEALKPPKTEISSEPKILETTIKDNKINTDITKKESAEINKKEKNVSTDKKKSKKYVAKKNLFPITPPPELQGIILGSDWPDKIYLNKEENK